MERRVVFLVLAAFVAAVSCNLDNVSFTEEENKNSTADNASNNYQYKVKAEGSNVPCILASMTIAFTVDYKTKDDKQPTKQVQVPNNATATGNCASPISELVLTWGEKNKESTVKFLLLNDYTMFSVVSVTLNHYIILDAAEERVKKVYNTDTGILGGSVVDGLSKCNNHTIKFDESSNMTMTNITLIAFNNNENLTQRKAKECQPVKIFPYTIPSNDNPTPTRAKMMIVFEIPYKHTNGSVIKYIPELPLANVNNLSKKEGNKQSHNAVLEWKFPSNKEYYKMSLTIREHDNGSAYIDAVAVDIEIAKPIDGVPVNVIRKGNLDLRLFPVALGNGLYSCETGKVLRFGDIKITLKHVLFAPFNNEKSWEARKVVDCNQEEKKQFNYLVNDPNLGVSCILGNMTIEMNVTYTKKDNNTENKVIQVPSNATTVGHCDEYTPYMELTWAGSNEDSKKDIMNKLRLSLYKDTKTGLYFANFVRADIYLHSDNFPNAAKPDQYLHHNSNWTLKLFPNKMINGYYKCPEPIEATIDKEVKINITNVLLMAFNDQEDISIKTKESGCFKDDDKDDSKEDNKEDDKNDGKNDANHLVQTFYYHVNNTKTNVPCILANMTISVKLNYHTKDGTKEVNVIVPKNATYNGTCGDYKSELHFMWSPEKLISNFTNSLTLTFGKASSRFFLEAIKTNISLEGGNFTGSDDSLMYFAADATNGFYKCESKVEVAMDTFTVIFNNLTLIAFNEDKDLSHILQRSEENCSTANVGAIVGGIIGGLVIVAIIGFVIYTCRRNRYY